MCYLWLLSSCNDRAEWLQQRLYGLQHLKHLLSGPSPQCSLALGLEEGNALHIIYKGVCVFHSCTRGANVHTHQCESNKLGSAYILQCTTSGMD